MSAFVEKKTGFDGSRTLIQGGFCARCKAESIFAQDIEQSYKVKEVTKVKLLWVEARGHPERSVAESKHPANQLSDNDTGFLDCARNDVRFDASTFLPIKFSFCLRAQLLRSIHRPIQDRRRLECHGRYE